jgi:hypothetical protein
LPLSLLWVACDLAGALAGGRGYPHYFLPLAASLSVTAGLTYWFLVDGTDGARRTGINGAVFALILGPLLIPQILDVRQLMQWGFFANQRYDGANDWEAVAAHLNALHDPSDTLFTWDYMPGVYFATGMHSPVRLLSAHRIFDSVYSHWKFGEEVSRRIEQAPPTFLVDGWNNAAMESLRAGDPLYRRFREFIERHYVSIYTVGRFRVYKYWGSRKVAGE